MENNREVQKGKIRALACIRERTIRKIKEKRLRTIGYPEIRRWAERTGIWALCRDSGHQGPVQKQRRAPGREWKGAHDGASKARDGASKPRGKCLRIGAEAKNQYPWSNLRHV